MSDINTQMLDIIRYLDVIYDIVALVSFRLKLRPIDSDLRLGCQTWRLFQNEHNNSFLSFIISSGCTVAKLLNQIYHYFKLPTHMNVIK